jgi:O-antigen biosynthesis protein
VEAVARLPAMSDASAEQKDPAPRYDFEGIDLDSGSVHADVVTLVDGGSRVLELGPATGYMTHAFKERGCTVVGIELDPEMAANAERFTERMIVGDIDRLDLEKQLGEERFDAIVAADVLEHLRDPLKILVELKKFLKPDGCFVVSFPNVAHGSVRLSLLSGRFDYQDIGLLDSTHLRFFTRESFEELLDEAELGLAVLHRHELNLDASEVPFDGATVSPELRERLEGDPDARTYQYVVKALPMSQPGLREMQARMRELAELREVRDDVETLNGRIAELEGALAAIGGREGELRTALIEAHDQLLRRDAEMDSLREDAQRAIDAKDGDLENVRTELNRVNDELVAALGGLQRIRTSGPYRVMAALKSLLRR